MRKRDAIALSLTKDEAQFVVDVLVNAVALYHVLGNGRHASALAETIRWKINAALDKQVKMEVT